MLVFVGSNSSKSINEQLTKSILKTLELNHIFFDLKKCDIPMFSEDLEKQIKSPDAIVELKSQIDNSEMIFIATNEHNGFISAYLKNILDWLSRINVKFLENKKVFILSTSKGKRGGLGANETLQQLVVKFGCIDYQHYAFASFADNFDIETQEILNKEFLKEIEYKINLLLNK